MNKLNICIDIDGTITSPYHFIPYLNELYNKNITQEECNTHKLEKLYNVDIESLLQEFHANYMHSYGEAKLVEGAKEIIDKLKQNNNLYFVTARNECLTDVTTSWLKENEILDIDVYLLGSDYKIQKAKELECDIFIEDNPSNAIQLAEEGIRVLLVDTNYNKNIEHDNIIRVNGWTDICNFIEKQA